MRRRRTTILVGLSAIFVVFAMIWVSAMRSRQTSQEAVAALADERMAFVATERIAHERIAVAEKTQQAALAAITTLRGTQSSAARQPTAGRLRTQSEIIASSPSLELLELQRQRAAAKQEYRRFFQRLGMTADEVARFCDLKVKHAENWMDVQAAARKQEAGRDTIDRLQAELKVTHDAAFADLLGPEGFKQLQEFEQSITAYNVLVRGLAGAAALEGFTLTPEQGESLLAAAVGASRGRTARGDIDLATLDWAALDATARQILTPQQFTLFKHVEAPSGFQGRWKYELDGAVGRALRQEATERGPATPKRDG